MAASITNRLLFYSTRNTSLLSSVPCVSAVIQKTQLLPVRLVTNKHHEPKWKALRRMKRSWVPGLEELLKEEKERAKDPWDRKTKPNRDIPPPRTYKEREIIISCTNMIMEPFVPPEGDGKASALSAKRLSQEVTSAKKGTTAWRHKKKLLNFEEDFNTNTFPDEALEVYKKGIELLNTTKDFDDLSKYYTEMAIPIVTRGLDKKTLRWEFKGSLEPPRVVHLRCQELLTKDNMFAQITVRFLSQQTMAIYDRFGRLIYGSEDMLKDVLEYVVFEKHITEEYGSWRIHGKVTPEWLREQNPVYIPTHRVL